MLHALNVLWNVRKKQSLPQEAHKYFFRVSLSRSIGVDIERGTRNAIGTNNIDHLQWFSAYTHTHPHMHAHWYRNYIANASYLNGYIPINADKCVFT